MSSVYFSRSESRRDITLILGVAMLSGLFIDTSAAFTTATLGTRKADPKARYSLVLQAAEAFESEHDYQASVSPRCALERSY